MRRKLLLHLSDDLTPTITVCGYIIYKQCVVPALPRAVSQPKSQKCPWSSSTLDILTLFWTQPSIGGTAGWFCNCTGESPILESWSPSTGLEKPQLPNDCKKNRFLFLNPKSFDRSTGRWRGSSFPPSSSSLHRPLGPLLSTPALLMRPGGGGSTGSWCGPGSSHQQLI